MSDGNPSAVALEQIAERALTFQRYIFRRAWGTYYAVWAIAYIAFVFGGVVPFPLQSFFPENLSWVPYAIVYGGVGWGAGIATMWIFKNAHRTISLRKAVGSYRPLRGRGFTLMWIWWAIFFVLAGLIFVYIPKEALSILFAMLFSVEIFIYYSLKFSFPTRIPIEGVLALTSYGICVVLSFFVSLFASNFLIIDFAWGITIAVWLFCSFYALWRASEELEPLIY
jgi:hypothetical protein